MRPATVTETMKKDIRRRIRLGEKPASVARDLNLSLATVYRATSGMNLKLVRTTGKDKELEKATMKIYADLRESPASIARLFGVTPQYVGEVIR